MKGNLVDREEFDRHVDQLSLTILGAITAYFQSKRIAFDAQEFLAAGSESLDDLVRSSIFSGAETFPIRIDKAALEAA